MTRKEYWELFKETGKIEYYLQYKKSIIYSIGRLCFMDDTFIIKKQSPPGGGFCAFLGDIKKARFKMRAVKKN